MAFMKYDVFQSVVPSGSDTGAAVTIPEWAGYLGLTVPAYGPSGTVKLQVSPDNSTWTDLYDGSGNVIPNWSANSGPRALSMIDCGGALPWQYVRPVFSAAQNAARTLVFACKKVTS